MNTFKIRKVESYVGVCDDCGMQSAPFNLECNVHSWWNRHKRSGICKRFKEMKGVIE